MSGKLEFVEVITPDSLRGASQVGWHCMFSRERDDDNEVAIFTEMRIRGAKVAAIDAAIRYYIKKNSYNNNEAVVCDLLAREWRKRRYVTLWRNILNEKGITSYRPAHSVSLSTKEGEKITCEGMYVNRRGVF